MAERKDGLPRQLHTGPRDKEKEKRGFHYSGFPDPYYTMVPDDLFDVIAPNLTEGELRVLLYIIRRTFGFKKDKDNISISQMVKGIITKDKRQLDYGTGMGKPAVVRSVTGLEEKGIIVAQRNMSDERGNEPTTYALHFEKDAPLYPKDTRGGISKIQGLVLQGNTQETVLQDHQKQIEGKGKRPPGRRPKGTDPDAYFSGPFARLIQG